MHRNRLIRIAVTLAVVFTVLGVSAIAALRSTWAGDYIKRKATTFLEERLDARIEIASMQMVLYPALAVSGTGFRAIRHDSVTGLPLMAIANFQIAGSPWALLRRRVSRIDLDGVELNIQRGAARPTGVRRTGDVLIDTIVVRNSRLLILPRNPEKLPLDFPLHEVTMKGFGFDRSSTFTAQLTNPKPSALIESEGRIGPWDTGEIGSTPVAGAYTLAHGDLGTIKGIGGELESTGKYEGVLERIHVEGTTSSRNFHLKLAENEVPLQTTFVATVDGTSGDTILERVDAVLGESRLTARGAIESTPGVKGRSISLQVTADDANFEDLLRLSVRGKGEAPMRGRLNLNTTFLLPPSEEDVPLRLQLNGRFAISRGHFTSDLVQDKVDELSRRGRGQPGNQAVDNVFSSFGGTFTLNKGVLTLPNLRFSVNGARVDLQGNYRLPSETMEFRGTLSLDAPVSKTVTGFKSFLLKAIDPVFRRNGVGTQLPIAITGTVQKPSFRVEPGRIFRR